MPQPLLTFQLVQTAVQAVFQRGFVACPDVRQRVRRRTGNARWQAGINRDGLVVHFGEHPARVTETRFRDWRIELRGDEFGFEQGRPVQPHHVQSNAPRQKRLNLACGLQFRCNLGTKFLEGFRVIQFCHPFRQKAMLDRVVARARDIFWSGGLGGITLVGGDFGSGAHGVISDYDVALQPLYFSGASLRSIAISWASLI